MYDIQENVAKFVYILHAVVSKAESNLFLRRHFIPTPKNGLPFYREQLIC